MKNRETEDFGNVKHLNHKGRRKQKMNNRLRNVKTGPHELLEDFDDCGDFEPFQKMGSR